MTPNLLAQIPYSATYKLYIYEIFIFTLPGLVFSSVKWEEKIIFKLWACGDRGSWTLL